MPPFAFVDTAERPRDRAEAEDRRAVEPLLRVSMGAFSVALLIASVQLLRGSPTIFPWTIEPETETMFGWLFLGSAAYFLYGFLRPSWHNARGQLLAPLISMISIPSNASR